MDRSPGFVHPEIYSASLLIGHNITAAEATTANGEKIASTPSGSPRQPGCNLGTVVPGLSTHKKVPMLGLTKFIS